MAVGCSQSTFYAKEGIVVAVAAGIVRMEKREIYRFLENVLCNFPVPNIQVGIHPIHRVFGVKIYIS